MAAAQTHFRSISLPSRLDQISPDKLESQFEKLRNCSAASESIQSGLLGLAELYNSIGEFTQRSAVHRGERSMEESLSQSVDLLDACTAIKELLQMMRENVHSLQSALRRKGTESGVQNDVAAYFCFRKRMQKTLVKTLKSLKKSESAVVKNGSVSDGGLFRQLAGVTISVFKKVIEFWSYAAAASGWSLVSKAMAAKSGRGSGAVNNEVEKMDWALSCLQGKRKSDGCRFVDAQKSLQIVDGLIEGFEGGFERLLRQLVQTRVTLLNILTDH